jgi:uncharacterized repeat protein (TIGR02543 family)
MLFLASSCSAKTVFTGSIAFYDGTTQLGDPIKGTSGQEISDADKVKIAGYENKENYIFKGWCTTSDLSSYVDVKLYPYSDISVYAKFVASVTITLKAGDGSFAAGAVTTYSGAAGDAIPTDFPSPTKDKAAFDHWVIEGSSDKFTSKFFPDSSVTLTAVYTDWPTLSFVTDVPSYTIDSVQIKAGEKVPATLIDESKLTKGANYRFEGWYKESTFKNRFNFEQMPAESLTIYAKFLLKHTISFDSGLGSSYAITETIDAFEGDKILAPAFDDSGAFKLDGTKFKKSNYYFVGWFDDASGATSAYVFNQMPGADLTLTAHWSVDPVITFYAADKTTSLGTISNQEPGTGIVLSDYVTAPTDGKNTFLGWFNTESVDSVLPTYIDHDDGDKEKFRVPSKNASYFAKFRTNYQLTVKFVDPYKNLLATVADYTDIWGSEGSDMIAEPTSKVQSYLTANYPLTFGNSSLYKLVGFKTDNTSTGVTQTFPMSLTADGTIYAVLASKVNLTLYADTYDSAHPDVNKIGVVSGFQGEDITATYGAPISTGDTDILAYSLDTGKAKATYQFFQAYTEGSVMFDLPSFFPSHDYIAVLVFTTIPENT